MVVFIQEAALPKGPGIDLAEVAGIIQKEMERADLKVVSTASNGNQIINGYLTTGHWSRVLRILKLPALRYNLDTNEVIGPDPTNYNDGKSLLSAVVENITESLFVVDLVYDPQRGSYVMEQPR